MLFLLLTSPFWLFILKNNILHQSLGIESSLPFGIPLLPAQRLEQINSGILENLVTNLHWVLNRFDDHLIWNSPKYSSTHIR